MAHPHLTSVLELYKADKAYVEPISVAGLWRECAYALNQATELCDRRMYDELVARGCIDESYERNLVEAAQLRYEIDKRLSKPSPGRVIAQRLRESALRGDIPIECATLLTPTLAELCLPALNLNEWWGAYTTRRAGPVSLRLSRINAYIRFVRNFKHGPCGGRTSLGRRGGWSSKWNMALHDCLTSEAWVPANPLLTLKPWVNSDYSQAIWVRWIGEAERYYLACKDIQMFIDSGIHTSRELQPRLPWPSVYRRFKKMMPIINDEPIRCQKIRFPRGRLRSTTRWFVTANANMWEMLQDICAQMTPCSHAAVRGIRGGNVTTYGFIVEPLALEWLMMYTHLKRSSDDPQLRSYPINVLSDDENVWAMHINGRTLHAERFTCTVDTPCMCSGGERTCE